MKKLSGTYSDRIFEISAEFLNGLNYPKQKLRFEQFMRAHLNVIAVAIECVAEKQRDREVVTHEIKDSLNVWLQEALDKIASPKGDNR